MEINVREVFETRYQTIDSQLTALEQEMLPENDNSPETVAEASYYYHKLMADRWEIKIDELAFYKWRKEQTYGI